MKLFRPVQPIIPGSPLANLILDTLSAPETCTHISLTTGDAYAPIVVEVSAKNPERTIKIGLTSIRPDSDCKPMYISGVFIVPKGTVNTIMTISNMNSHEVNAYVDEIAEKVGSVYSHFWQSFYEVFLASVGSNNVLFSEASTGVIEIWDASEHCVANIWEGPKAAKKTSFTIDSRQYDADFNGPLIDGIWGNLYFHARKNYDAMLD